MDAHDAASKQKAIGQYRTMRTTRPAGNMDKPEDVVQLAHSLVRQGEA